MLKWKQTYKAGRKYQKRWERDYPWIKHASDGMENAIILRAISKLCSKLLQPKAAVLLKHSKSALVNSSSSTCPIPVVGQHAMAIDDDVKKCELEKLAAATCCRCPIYNVDRPPWWNYFAQLSW